MEIDLKANKLLVAPKNSSLAMVLNTSNVKKVSGYAGPSDIKAGDWVQATYEAKVGVMYALTVAKAKEPEEAKKSAPKPGKPTNHP